VQGRANVTVEREIGGKLSPTDINASM